MSKEQAKKISDKDKLSIKSLINKEKNFYLRHKLLGTLLIILGVWALIWFGQAVIERYNFYRVEKTMDKINQQINSNFNVVSERKERACGTRDEAFGESLGGCSVSYTYKVSVPNNAKQTAVEIDKLLRSREDVKISNPDPSLFRNTTFIKVNKVDSQSAEYSSSYNFNNVSNPTCEVIYNLTPSAVEKNIDVNIACFLSGKSAEFPYFPVQN